MTISESLSLIIQIVQTLILIIGIPLVIRQIRQQTNAIRVQSESFQLSTYMKVMAEGTRISEMAIDDSELAEFYDQEKLPEDLSNAWRRLNDKHRKFYLYFGRNLSLMEQAFMLWKREWMDNIDYSAMLAHLREIMGLRIFNLWWPNMRPYYRSDFVAYVDSLQGKDRDTFFKLATTK